MARADTTSSETVADALQRKSLSGIFNAYVRETVTAFPEMAGHFAILNIPEGQIHCSIDFEQSRFKHADHAYDVLNRIATRFAPEQSSFAYFKPEHNLGIIIYNGPKYLQMFADPVQEGHKNIVGILDHELGHLLGKGAYGAKNTTEWIYAESVADTFAGVRHMTRYDGPKTDIEYLSWQRTHALFEHGDTDHFTSFALDELVKVADDVDFKKITPHQSVFLAERIASAHAPHASVVESLTQQLRGFSTQQLRTEGYEQVLKPIADAMLRSPQSYYTNRVVDKLLSPFLMEEVVYRGAPVLLDGPYWDRVRIELSKRTDQMEKQGILAGLPVKAKPPTLKS